MFDWNDHELTDIIWGESDDHIVPYPEASKDSQNKKEWNHEAATRPNDQKTPGAKVDLHGRKPESSSYIESCKGIPASGFTTNSWPNLSLSNVKTEQDSRDTGLYQSSKEQADFVDYGWANIGSFDDLDRMLSNNDTIFGNVNLGKADELWSSSRDVTHGPSKSFRISSESPSLDSGPLDVKAELVQQVPYGKMDDSGSCSLQNVHAVLDNVEDAGDNIMLTTKEQVNSQKTMYGAWFSSINHSAHFQNQLVQSTIQSSSTSLQQRSLQEPESFPYQQITSQTVAPLHENLTNPYSAMPVLTHIHPSDFQHQSLHSRYESSPSSTNTVKKTTKAPAKPLTMTPQEKIEKLRRRQQLQAMLAIQKQKKQFSHQMSSTNHYTTQKFPKQNQFQHFQGADLQVDDLSTLPSTEPNSPLERDDSNTLSAAHDEYSMEDTILYRLQNVITKLDIKIRLCMRDSLFRLAQSATQRHYASDTGSTSGSNREEHEVITNEETTSYNRYSKRPNLETETNPIDRTVAQLLFHRPDSSASIKLASEGIIAGGVGLPTGSLTETWKSKQGFIPQEFKDGSHLNETQAVETMKE